MRHFATAQFSAAFERLPESIQAVARRNFALLKAERRHPSLRLKKVGEFWSVRAGSGYRALARQNDNGDMAWFWIGAHDEYDRLTR